MSSSLARPEGLIITKLQLQDGYFTARVSQNGETVAVDNRYGSWQATLETATETLRREVLPAAATALQSALPSRQAVRSMR